MNNINIIKEQVRDFVRTFEILILDRIISDDICSNDFKLYFDICNKFHIEPSLLIIELDKKNNNY